MAESVIIANKLRKQYQQTTAVDQVSFEIQAGECFGFLGPNGAGKTTLMKMLYCFYARTSGDLSIFGMDPVRDARRIKGKIGVVPQEENLDPDLTVIENMIVFGRYFNLSHKLSYARGLQLLDFVQLLEKSKEKIERLSGGMKRRLLIARALINEPSLIILDEPTTGLDPQARHLVWQKLRQLKEKGATLLLTTHYMEEAERLCDRLVIMDHGKFLTLGKPRELVDKHVGHEVLELHVGEDRVDAMVKKMARFHLPSERSGGTLYFSIKNGQDLREVYPLIQGEDFFHRKASLEDVFLRLSGRELVE